MKHGWTILAGAGAGAGLMYLLDPNMGNRRRALMRDQFVGAASRADDAFGKTWRDARNRAQGLISEVRGASKRSRGDRPLDVLQDHWAPATRAMMGVLGGGLAAYGF